MIHQSGRWWALATVVGVAAGGLMGAGPADEAGAGNAAATRATTRAAAVAAAARDPIAEGRAAARRDIAAGAKLTFWMPLHEAFFLTSMGPGGSDSHLLEYFKAVVADRYGVTVRTELIIPGGPDENGRWRLAYGEEVAAAVDAKYGKGTMQRTWEKACAMKDADRQAFLDARQRKAAVAVAAVAATQPRRLPRGRR